MSNKNRKIELIILIVPLIMVGLFSGDKALAVPNWVDGEIGSALEFDGLSYIDIGDAGDVQTIEFWINDSNDTDGILELIDDSTYLSISGGAVAATGFTSPTVYINGNSGSAALNDGWNYVAVVDVASVAAASMTIGEANGDFMEGIIDEVRIYSRALSAKEIRYHYNRGGPVAHWKFDEGSGTTAYDSTDNNNDGTLYGEMATSTLGSSGWTSGKHGSALSFDGVDDYVDLGNDLSIEPGVGDFTVGLWMKSNQVADQKYTLFMKGQAGSKGIRLQFDDGVNAGKLLATILDVDSDSVYTVTESTYNDNEWHYVSVVVDRDSSEFKIYVDGSIAGKPASLSVIGDITNATYGWHLGKQRTAYLLYYDGFLDDVRFYSYARTPEEIKLDYNAGYSARFGPLFSCDRDPGACMNDGLVGYWNFEEGEGGLASDKSGNGNNGTLTNGPAWAGGIVPLSGGKSGGGALQFDGNDDYVDCGSDVTLRPQDLTIEMWVKGPSIADYDGLVGNAEIDGQNGYRTAKTNTHYFQGLIGDASSYEFISGTTVIDDNVWHHLVFTVDAFYLRIYVDGVEDQTAVARTKTMTWAHPTIIGNYGDLSGNEYFHGFIDEVKIYNRALSAEEVRYHYNRGDPVAYWKLDEGAGSIAYNSTNEGGSISIDGTLMGEMATSTASNSGWTTGKHGGALSFDGVDDYVSVPAVDALDITNEISISAWAKANSLDSSGDGIVYKPNVWGLDIKSDGAIRSAFYTSDNGNLIAYDSDAGEITTNEWFHVAVTYDGANVKIYKNGVRVKSFALTGAIQTSVNNLKIGEEYNSTYNFNGLIDEVRIYNYARTAEQVRQDYNAGLAAYFGPQTDCDRDPGACIDEGLVSYWDMDEGTGTLITDKSGNGNNGTTTNMTTPWTQGVVPFSGGRAGGSGLYFDNINDYVACGNSNSLNFGDSTDFSVSAWVKTTNISDIIIHKGDGTGDASHGFWLYNTNTGVLEAGLTDGEGLRKLKAGTVSINTGEWVHLVATFDRDGLLTLYVNGVEDGTTGIAGEGDISPGSYPFRIGARDGASQSFSGVIDDVRVYARVLSSAEVRYHYNRGAPVAHWKFDEGSGTTVYDATSNNNNGTMYWMSTSTNAWIQGRVGGALQFDGTDDYISVTGTGSTIGTGDALTISIWTKPDDQISGAFTYHKDIIRSNCLGGNGLWGISTFDDYNSSERVKLLIGWITGSGTWWNINENIVEKNKWNHLVLLMDRITGKAQFYRNGQLISETIQVVGSRPTTSAVNIAKDCGGEYRGFIDDVRIYNYARSEEQIRQDYNAGLSTHFR
jgi:hypothetical protein